MRNPTDRTIQKEVILKKCFDCLVQTGLEKVSMRDFSRESGLTSSSLYYWFRDKDEIILDATDYGVNLIVSELFDYAFRNIQDVEKMCSGFPQVIIKHSSELKTMIQMATSPQYGKQTVEMSEKFSVYYDMCANEIFNIVDTPYDQIRKLIDLFVSAVIDCVVWDDWNKLSEEINLILKLMLNQPK